jgi:S-adenosylmethionine synthetase
MWEVLFVENRLYIGEGEMKMTKKEKWLFTSESVSEGHPDKVCDQIADAILDECLAGDPASHVACEVFATTEYILIGGEITSKSHVDYEKVAREVLRKIGYTKPELGIGCDTCFIDVKIKEQSPDIAMGVNRGDILKMGAGDQGIMFGYATNESEGYMPLPVTIAHKLGENRDLVTQSGPVPWRASGYEEPSHHRLHESRNNRGSTRCSFLANTNPMRILDDFQEVHP